MYQKTKSDLETNSVETNKASIEKSRVSATVNASTHYEYYLYEEISDASNYIDLIRMLKTAKEEDKVTIYINSFGGYMHTTVQIIAAMRNCKAKVFTRVEGYAASCATMIFLCGEDRAIADHSIFMAHNYSGGGYGKGHELVASVNGRNKIHEATFRSIYKGFLTDDEIKCMLKGEDYWFGADEVRERLERLR